MLTVGDTFPSFSLQAVKGGAEGLSPKTAFTTIDTNTDAGKWKVVFFWPKDFTFVCPT
ncbi:MAG TPA: redoxin domain-containing protein, partial [Acetobacteraceae bacterium]